MSVRSTVARVDLTALTGNFRALARHLSATAKSFERFEINAARRPPPGIIAVIKANAYGHGAVQVGATLERAGADVLAVADIPEGLVLRKAGIRAPILVFGALSTTDLAGLFEYDLIPTISTPSAARAVEDAARARGRRVPCHLKIDTGMHRLGFRDDNLRRTVAELASSPHLDIAAAYTHFATADEAGHALFDEQRDRFARALAELAGLGIRPRAIHAANSAALLQHPDVWFDYVRPGLLLYGIAPPPLVAPFPLRPVLTLTSAVVAVKGLRPGESVGYGARFTAPRPATLAVVPAGYADGLDRRLAGRGSALVRGRRAPIIGSVCMDLITIDVTGADVAVGDEVVLLGEQNGARIDAREMADAIGTIPYEILCRIGTRVERVYNQ